MTRRPRAPATSASSSARRSSPRPRRSTASPTASRGSSDAGAAAIVLPSLFEEEILHEEIELNRVARAGHRALRRGARLLPGGRRRSRTPADRYLAALERVKAQSTSRSSPASTRRTTGGWVRYARLHRRTPAPTPLELNLYHVAADPTRTRGRRRGRRPRRSSRPCAPRSTIPLAVKLSPYYSAMANFAARGRRRRRRRARAVQPLLPTRPRPRHPRRRAAASS